MFEIVIAALVFVVLLYFAFYFSFRKNKRKKGAATSPQQKQLMSENVAYYNGLDDNEKVQFEERIQDFLANCKVTGISCRVEELDRLLVASGAIIPVFAFPNWKYYNLDEVLIYPDRFDSDYQTGTEKSNILGMVGTGVMEGKMIISKNALREGFTIGNDKKNTAIHEFVHLIDKADGVIDGIPKALHNNLYAIPWLNLIKRKIDEIQSFESDINPYGATNNAEFFSVAAEYFFERPRLLQEKHPDLYASLEKIFLKQMSKKELNTYNIKSIGRNEDCPCGSGKKFKKCCGSLAS
jgi:Mlc titration factor MtfA (ptsG expression regulator)